MRKGHWSTYQWLGIMSRMSREVHVRFWERLGVKFPRATRHMEDRWSPRLGVPHMTRRRRWCRREPCTTLISYT